MTRRTSLMQFSAVPADPPPQHFVQPKLPVRFLRDFLSRRRIASSAPLSSEVHVVANCVQIQPPVPPTNIGCALRDRISSMIGIASIAIIRYCESFTRIGNVNHVVGDPSSFFKAMISKFRYPCQR